MKKFLYTIGFLMFFTAFFSPVLNRTALGADANGADPCQTTKGQSYSSAEKCVPFSTARIFEKMHLPVLNDTDWSDTFGTDNPEKAGQNMYAKIYNMTINQPEQKAVKNITGKYGVTEAEMTQVLYGNFGSILDRKPTLRQEDAINLMNQIQQQFQEEKDLLQFQASLSASVSTNEFFANGDVNDSGFDLINDLNLIEKILFLKADPIDVGGAFDYEAFKLNGNNGNDQHGNNNGGNGAGQNNGQGKDKNGTQQVSGNNDNGSGNKNGAGGNQNGNGNGSSGQNGGQSSNGTGPNPANPNSCLTNNNLSSALNQFDQNKQKDPNFKDGSQGGSGNDGSNNGSNNGSNSNNNSQGTNGNNKNGVNGTPQNGTATHEPFTFQEPTPAPAQNAPADNWLKTPPCNDVFCLSINFVKKKASAYTDNDNCIACHIEKINEKLKQTVDHSLTPGKATGNLAEPGTCKKASSNSLQAIGLNFYAIAQPVMTPRNDDLIYGVGVQEEWKSFVDAYKPFPVYELNVPPASDPNADAPPTVIDRATKSAVVTSSDTTTQSDVVKNAQAEIAGQAEEQAKKIKIAATALQSDVDVGYYQAIRRELDQMNYYFTLYQNILHSLHEKVESIAGAQACVDLKDKKQCK